MSCCPYCEMTLFWDCTCPEGLRLQGFSEGVRGTVRPITGVTRGTPLRGDICLTCGHAEGYHHLPRCVTGSYQTGFANAKLCHCGQRCNQSGCDCPRLELAPF